MPWKIAPGRSKPVNVWKETLQKERLLKPWQTVLPYHEMSDLDHVTLTPGDPSSFLTDRKIKDCYNHKYFPDSKQITRTITKNTIFWYPREHFNIYPPDRPAAVW